MSLFIDLQGTQTDSRERGIGRYTRDLVKALLEHPDAPRSLYLGWNASLPDPFESWKPRVGNDQRIFSSPYGALPREKYAQSVQDVQRDLNDRLLRHHILSTRCRHALFSSIMETDNLNFTLPLNLNYKPQAFSYSIIYDIIPILFKDIYLRKDSFIKQYESHLYTNLSADTLFAISDKTRDDLIRVCHIDPDRIVTIGGGIDRVNFHSTETTPQSFAESLRLTKPFLFFLGGEEFRKNLTGFVEAMARLDERHKSKLQALIAGKVSPEKQAQLFAMAQQAGMSQDSLVFAPRLSETELRYAYQSCAITVVPSLYEGFGLPVLEAMASGAPVIASDNSSMSEILTDKRFLFDADNPAHIAHKIAFVLDNPEAVISFKESYAAILSAHSWDFVAEKVIASLAKNEAANAGAGVFHPAPTYLEMAVFGMPDPDWRDRISALGQITRLTLYGDNGNLSTLQSLPLRIRSLATLNQNMVRNDPIISLICDLEGLVTLSRNFIPSDHIVVLNKVVMLQIIASLSDKTAISSKQGAALLTYLREACALWFYDEDHMFSLNHPLLRSSTDALIKHFSTPSLDFIKTTASASFLLSEAHHHSLTRPYAQALSLKQILQSHGKLGRLSRKVSELAAISQFGTHLIDLN